MKILLEKFDMFNKFGQNITFGIASAVLTSTHSLCFGATRIVRGSDYSPASKLFPRVRKTITGHNTKLMLMHIKRLVRFCQFVLKRLSGNEILTPIKARNSVKIDRQQSQATCCQC